MSRSSSNQGRHRSPFRSMRNVPARTLNQKYSFMPVTVGELRLSSSAAYHRQTGAYDCGEAR